MYEVRDIIDEFGTSNPFTIADYAEIEYSYEALPESVEGITIDVFGKPYIILNNNLMYNRKQYVVMAHELCHALFHHGLGEVYTSFYNGKGKFEAQADNFATALMSEFFVEQYGDEPYSFDVLKNNFYVKESTREYYRY